VSAISGTPIQYSAGGGGGLYDGGTAGIGGSANAGNGGVITSTVSAATSGIANTGCGGGGGSYKTASGATGAGGSGIVIIRYPSYLLPAASTTGSPETYIAGQYRVYKFVANGTITF
jgi:hypothetical protein